MQHNESLAKVFSRALYTRNMAGYGCRLGFSNGFSLGHSSIYYSEVPEQG